MILDEWLQTEALARLGINTGCYNNTFVDKNLEHTDVKENTNIQRLLFLFAGNGVSCSEKSVWCKLRTVVYTTCLIVS